MSAPCLLLCTLLPTIWIVDASNGPGTNFTDIPDAVAAAATGDTILVRPGNYSAFAVSGKALTIRGSGAATTMVVNPPPWTAFPYQQTTIENVPAGAAFYVGRLAFSPQVPSPVNLPSNPAIRVQGAQTQVVLADVTATGIALNEGTPGLEVSAGAIVHATRCTFSGGAGTTGSGGAGARVVQSALAADASTFTGGIAPVALFAIGGAGVQVLGGVATLARSSVTGAAGGFAGGHGVVSQFAPGVGNSVGFVRIAGTTATTITGGAALFVTPNVGIPLVATTGSGIIVHGPVLLVPAVPGGQITGGLGVITTGAVPLPYLSDSGTTNAAGEMDATQPVTVVFDGAIPSAPFACAVELAPAFFTSLPLLLGHLLVPLTASIDFEGTLDANGMAQVTLTPANDVPWLTNVPIYAQFGVLDATAGVVRSSNAAIRVYSH